MTALRTLVTVLNYHGEETLFACLASILPTLEPGDQLLVVDNGNETALLHAVRQRFPDILVAEPHTNLGFAVGMNIGLRRALADGFDAAWIVNNDATVSPDALPALKQAARGKRGPHLFSPVIVTPTGMPWFAGGRISWLRMRAIHRHSRPASLQPFQTDFLTGCALFIPRVTLETVGLLDEAYFLYYEDADYSVRTVRQGGVLLVVPRAVVTHSEASRSNPEKLYWLVRSGVYFFLRQTPLLWRPWVRVYFFLRRAKNRVRRFIAPSPIAETLERAYTDALKQL